MGRRGIAGQKIIDEKEEKRAIGLSEPWESILIILKEEQWPSTTVVLAQPVRNLATEAQSEV